MSNADEILKKHEDANEMHFHDVDRKFIIEAMEEYAKEKSEKPINLEISDEEIEQRVKEVGAMGEYYKMGYRDAIIWYREQLKQRQ